MTRPKITVAQALQRVQSSAPLVSPPSDPVVLSARYNFLMGHPWTEVLEKMAPWRGWSPPNAPVERYLQWVREVNGGPKSRYSHEVDLIELIEATGFLTVNFGREAITEHVRLYTEACLADDATHARSTRSRTRGAGGPTKTGSSSTSAARTGSRATRSPCQSLISSTSSCTRTASSSDATISAGRPRIGTTTSALNRATRPTTSQNPNKSRLLGAYLLVLWLKG